MIYGQNFPEFLPCLERILIKMSFTEEKRWTFLLVLADCIELFLLCCRSVTIFLLSK